MIVLTLSACSPGLRGDVTKWLMEISTGVYVGNLSARVRDTLWQRVCKHLTTGEATMIYTARNEQGFALQVCNTACTPVDFDGVCLMRRPLPATEDLPNAPASPAGMDGLAAEVCNCKTVPRVSEAEREFAQNNFQRKQVQFPAETTISVHKALETSDAIVPKQKGANANRKKGKSRALENEPAQKETSEKPKKNQGAASRIMPYRPWPDGQPLPMDFSVIDMETTGLNFNQNRIIEVAAIRVRNGQVADEFQSLIRCEAPLPEMIVKLTGISDALLEEKGISEENALHALLEFIRADPIVGHNVAFDVQFLQNACSRLNLAKPDFCAIDTAQLSRTQLFGCVSNFRLETLARHFGFADKQSHRALEDSRLVRELYAKLNEFE